MIRRILGNFRYNSSMTWQLPYEMCLEESAKKRRLAARKQREWDLYFLQMTALVAGKSKDASTKCGALIVGPDNEVRSTGYNGLCRGCVYTAERQGRPEKYFWFEHAERNAIYNASRAGIATKDCTMYVTFLPCMDCARAIVQAGITALVCPPLTYETEHHKEKWQPHHKRTMVLLRECGVNVRFVHES